MATTTNFGWETPDDTDLVKDGAAAMRTLGNSIDTSFVDLKGGTTGQILSKASNTDLDYTWIANDQGDITGVTAGTGITGGGTSGAVTVSFDQANFGGGQNAAGKNAIINGGMDIWQRGTSFIGTGYNYTADRFLCFRGSFAAGMTITRQTSAQAGFQYALRTQRDSGNTGTQGMSTNYALETANSLQFAGKTVTISFYARAGANYSGGAYSCAIYSGTGTDQATSNLGSWTGTATLGATNATLTTTFQRFSFSVSVGSTATQIGFNLGWTPTGTAGANDWVEVTGIQLEASSTATPFQRAAGNIQGELAACQRYYFRTGGSQIIGSGYVSSTTTFEVNFQLPVTMRTAATFAGASGTSFYYAGIGAGNTGFNSVTQFFNSTNQSAQARFTGTALVAGQAGYVQTNNASSYIEASAEL